MSTLAKTMTVIDVVAQESVIDVVALINYYLKKFKISLFGKCIFQRAVRTKK